jgi:hypothetical protein
MNSQLAYRHRPTAKGLGSKTEAKILKIVQEIEQVREFQAIADRYVPKGCRVIYRSDLSGAYICKPPTLVRHLTRPIRRIEVPRPTTVESLHAFLQECAHAHLGHHDRRIRPSTSSTTCGKTSPTRL